MAGFPPLTVQGNLNRVATHIVVAAYPYLNANASYLGKSLAVCTFEPPFTDQIETATGIVNSPKPFVMSTIVISLLRSQSLAAAWLGQVQANSYLGAVTAFPDSSVFPAIALTNASITELDPGAFDGMDPVTKVTVKGTFLLNASLWAALTGSSGNLPPAV
jgi:hypothetical protein